MRIRDLQILAGLMTGISILLLISTFNIWVQPYPDITRRDIAKWQPTEDFTPAGFTRLKSQPVLSEALTRPLFRHSRRPFDPVQAALVAAVPEPAQAAMPQPAAPPPDASQLAVRGIVISGNTRLALITTPETPDGIWLATGADVMGWKIIDLGANGVTLFAGQQSLELKLYVDNKPN